MILVTQAVTESEVWPNAPVILPVKTDIHLGNGSFGITGVDAELRSAAAQSASAISYGNSRAAKSLLRRGKPALLHEQRAAITLKAAQLNAGAGDRIVVGVKGRTEATGESPLPTEITWVDVIDLHAAHAPAEFEGVRALLNLSKVIQLPARSFIDRVANLRASC